MMCLSMLSTHSEWSLLSLHDALPILAGRAARSSACTGAVGDAHQAGASLDRRAACRRGAAVALCLRRAFRAPPGSAADDLPVPLSASGRRAEAARIARTDGAHRRGVGLRV